VEPGLVSAAAATMICAAAGAAVAAVLAAHQRLRSALHVLAGAMALSGVLVATLVLPKGNPLKSARPLASTFARIADSEDPYGLYGSPLNAAFVFYAGRYGTHLRGREQLETFVEGPERRWLVVRRDHLEALGGQVPGMVEVVSERDWLRGWVLMTGPPVPRLAAGDVDLTALQPGAPPEEGRRDALGRGASPSAL
jgi:hypothetical protein